MNQWWSFTFGDIVFYVVFLVIVYAIFGPPSSLVAWLFVPVGILAGRWAFRKLGRGRR